MVVFTQHDAELGREAAEEQVREEDVRLLTAWASFQHGSKELGGAPGAKGLHLEETVHLLEVGQLVSIKDPGLEDGVGGEQQRVLHQVQYPADTLLAEAANQLVELCLFSGHAVGAEPGFC